MGAELIVKLLPLEQFEPHIPAWQALADHALEPNPFYGPDFLLASARALEKPGAITALTVWRAERLVGFLPFHRPNWREGLPFGVISAYWNPYVCMTTPLIAAEGAEETVSAMLGGLDEFVTGIIAINFPALPLHRQTGQALSRVLARESRPNIVISHYLRAILAPGSGMSFRDYVELESADARKSFRRRETRLMAMGKLEYVAFRDPGPLRAKALEQFLTLEASGWKGRYRTALLCQPDTRAFIAQAFRQDGLLNYEIERLSVDQVPVAMSLNLVSHGIVHTFKQAYDETWRSFAPGKLLDRQAIRRTIDSGAALTYDSCGLPGYPIEAIWHERMVIAHKLVGIGKVQQPRKLDAIARRAMRIQRVFRKLKRLRKWWMGSSAPKTPIE